MQQQKLALKFRVFHWGVAICVLLNAFILESGDFLHRYLGYFALILIILRISFQGQKKVTHYNPKAKYVYWLIWLCLFGLALTGFMLGLDRFFGDSTLEEIHEVISNLLLGLVCLHLLGIVFDAFQNKRKTWMVMFTGDKEI